MSQPGTFGSSNHINIASQSSSTQHGNFNSTHSANYFFDPGQSCMSINPIPVGGLGGKIIGFIGFEMSQVKAFHRALVAPSGGHSLSGIYLLPPGVRSQTCGQETVHERNFGFSQDPSLLVSVYVVNYAGGLKIAREVLCPYFDTLKIEISNKLATPFWLKICHMDQALHSFDAHPCFTPSPTFCQHKIKSIMSGVMVAKVAFNFDQKPKLVVERISELNKLVAANPNLKKQVEEDILTCDLDTAHTTLAESLKVCSDHWRNAGEILSSNTLDLRKTAFQKVLNTYSNVIVRRVFTRSRNDFLNTVSMVQTFLDLFSISDTNIFPGSQSHASLPLSQLQIQQDTILANKNLRDDRNQSLHKHLSVNTTTSAAPPASLISSSTKKDFVATHVLCGAIHMIKNLQSSAYENIKKTKTYISKFQMEQQKMAAVANNNHQSSRPPVIQIPPMPANMVPEVLSIAWLYSSSREGRLLDTDPFKVEIIGPAVPNCNSGKSSNSTTLNGSFNEIKVLTRSQLQSENERSSALKRGLSCFDICISPIVEEMSSFSISSVLVPVSANQQDATLNENLITLQEFIKNLPQYQNADLIPIYSPHTASLLALGARPLSHKAGPITKGVVSRLLLGTDNNSNIIYNNNNNSNNSSNTHAHLTSVLNLSPRPPLPIEAVVARLLYAVEVLTAEFAVSPAASTAMNGDGGVSSLNEVTNLISNLMLNVKRTYMDSEGSERQLVIVTTKSENNVLHDVCALLREAISSQEGDIVGDRNVNIEEYPSLNINGDFERLVKIVAKQFSSQYRKIFNKYEVSTTNTSSNSPNRSSLGQDSSLDLPTSKINQQRTNNVLTPAAFKIILLTCLKNWNFVMHVVTVDWLLQSLKIKAPGDLSSYTLSAPASDDNSCGVNKDLPTVTDDNNHRTALNLAADSLQGSIDGSAVGGLLWQRPEQERSMEVLAEKLAVSRRQRAIEVGQQMWVRLDLLTQQANRALKNKK